MPRTCTRPPARQNSRTRGPLPAVPSCAPPTRPPHGVAPSRRRSSTASPTGSVSVRRPALRLIAFPQSTLSTLWHLRDLPARLAPRSRMYASPLRSALIQSIRRRIDPRLSAVRRCARVFTDDDPDLLDGCTATAPSNPRRRRGGPSPPRQLSTPGPHHRIPTTSSRSWPQNSSCATTTLCAGAGGERPPPWLSASNRSPRPGPAAARRRRLGPCAAKLAPRDGFIGRTPARGERNLRLSSRWCPGDLASTGSADTRGEASS